jgi:MFS transporter, PHS family, inorganic phosphate transporter
MGVGIGGDYPLSAVISSEFAGTKIRGRMMTAVFAFQGWGNFGSLINLVGILGVFSDHPITSRRSCRNDYRRRVQKQTYP